MASQDRSRVALVKGERIAAVSPRPALPVSPVTSAVCEVSHVTAHRAGTLAFATGLDNAGRPTADTAVRLDVHPSRLYRMRDPASGKPVTIARLVQVDDEEFEEIVAAVRAARAAVRAGSAQGEATADPFRAGRAVVRAGARFTGTFAEVEDAGPTLTRDDAENLSALSGAIRRGLRRLDAALAPTLQGAQG